MSSSRRSRNADEGMTSLRPPSRPSREESPAVTPFQTASEARSSQNSQNQYDQDLKLKKKAAAGGGATATAGPGTDMPWQSAKKAGHLPSSKGRNAKINDLEEAQTGFDGKKGPPKMDAPQHFPMDDEEVAGESDPQIGAFAVQGRQVEHQDPGFISPHYDEEDAVQPRDPSTLSDGDPLPNTTTPPEANTVVEDIPVAAVLSPEPTPSTTVEEEVRRILAENTVEGQVIALDDNKNEEGENDDSDTSNNGTLNSKSKGFCNKYIIMASILACVIVGVVVGVVIALSGGGGGGGGSSNSSEETSEGSPTRSPSGSPTRSPTSSPVVPAVEDFCSDFSDIESYLAGSFANLWADDAQPRILSDGYDCTCVTKDPLEMKCDLRYSPPGVSTVFVNSEMCTFVLQDGQYLPKTAAWCESEDGSDNSHCETFEFCENGKSLCSCGTNEGNMCPSCAICTNKQDIALDCSGVENANYNYVLTCKDEYSGSFLNRYAFPEIRTTTEAPTSAPIAPDNNPTTAPTSNPTKTVTTPSQSVSSTKNPTLVPASSTLAPAISPVLPATLSPTRSPTQSPPTVPLQLCEENTDCQRGACAFETYTGSAQTVCCPNGISKFIYDWQVSPYPKSDDGRFCTGQAAGNACPFNDLCESAVCVFGECKDDYQSPGASCDDNADCQSGVCVDEVCKSTKQKASEPCEEDFDCEFNACGFEKYSGSAQLVCCPSGVREFIYDWQYNPYPKSDDGHFCTGQAAGDSCPYNKLCESGVCVYGQCMSETQDPDAACDDNADCASDVCISQRCQTGKRGPSEACGDNEDCEFNACAFETFTGSAQMVCCPNGISKFIYDWQVSPYPKSDDGRFCTGQAAGNNCPFNELCESGVCVFGECQSEAQAAGSACDENLDCQSSVCVSGVCLESRQDASESCEENEDCKGNACGFETYTGSAQMVCCPSGDRDFIYDWQYTQYPKSDDGHFCTGQATGAACPNNALCESGVCVSGQCLETFQAAGQPCDENLDCESTVCVSQVCMEGYQTSNEGCDDNQDCVLGKCGYESYTASSQLVCCASGEYDQIYTFEDSAYPKTDSAYFCTGQPTGARCANNALCASNTCTSRLCE